MTDHRGRLQTIGVGQEPARRRPDLQHVEIVGRDERHGDGTAVAAVEPRRTFVPKAGDAGERARGVPIERQFRVRELRDVSVDPAIDVACDAERELHDAIRVWQRQRPESDRVEQRHERRRHSDAKREHEDHRGAEDPGLAERACGVTAVSDDLLERRNTAPIAIGLCG